MNLGSFNKLMKKGGKNPLAGKIHNVTCVLLTLVHTVTFSSPKRVRGLTFL